MAHSERFDAWRPVARAGPAARDDRVGMAALISMERAKLLKRPMTWVCLALIAVGLAVIMALGYGIARSSNEAPAVRAENLGQVVLPGGIETSFQIIQPIAKLLLVVLAATLVGSEYGWGTIRVLVGSGVSRSRLLFAKLIALTQVGLLLLALGVVAGSLTSLAATLIEGQSATLGGFGAEWIGDLLLMFARSGLTLMVYALIAFTAAVLTRSVAAGLAIGLAWSFIVEPGLRFVSGSLGVTGITMQHWLMSTNANALLDRNHFGASSLGDGTPGAWQAAMILLLYGAVLLGTALVVFRRRDVHANG
jgi:ABC-2 type transport system permease protein